MSVWVLKGTSAHKKPFNAILKVMTRAKSPADASQTIRKQTTQNFEEDVHVWDDAYAVDIKYFVIVIYRHWTLVALLSQSTATPVIITKFKKWQDNN